MNDQGLRQYSFDESVGPEEWLVFGRTGLKDEPHQRESGVIEERADRPDFISFFTSPGIFF